jgi:hypothetical protein
MQQLHEIKRAHDDSFVDERPSKRKRVIFTEFCSMRQFEILLPDHEGTCQNNSTANVLSSCANDSAPSAVSERCVDLLRLSVSDTQTITKTQDGPSHATLVTNNLIRTLAKKKSMSRIQVADILRKASNHALPMSSCDVKVDDRPCADTPSPHAHLCMAVHDKLRALSERIEARGKASILPCCTNLNRSYLRALQFLTVSSTACISQEEPHISMAQG